MCVYICMCCTYIHTYVYYKSSMYPLSSSLALLSFLAPQVRSMGALLKFLDKHRVGVELEDTSVRIPLLAVKPFSLWVYLHAHTHMNTHTHEYTHTHTHTHTHMHTHKAQRTFGVCMC